MDAEKRRHALRVLRRKRVAVLLGGWSAEREISLKTGRAMAAALRRLGIAAREIDATRSLADQLRKARVELAVLALHGPWGEDGRVQGLLEVLGIPYSGSGVLASALAMDKEAAKRAFVVSGLKTAPWRLISSEMSGTRCRAEIRKIGLPAVVKPVTQGSAIGVTIVRSEKEIPRAFRDAFRYDTRALVERFIPGREMTVGVLDGIALPVVEIVPKRAFYDFKAKYAPGMSEHLIPAPLSAALSKRLQKEAVRACEALGCRGAARVDFRLSPSGTPFILEVNTVPGMTERSLLPEAAANAGIPFDELVLRIAAGALG